MQCMIAKHRRRHRHHHCPQTTTTSLARASGIGESPYMLGAPALYFGDHDLVCRLANAGSSECDGSFTTMAYVTIVAGFRFAGFRQSVTIHQ